MKRRTRPLDPGEYRSIERSTPLEVEHLDDLQDYVLKWPGSALAKLAMHDPAYAPQQHAHAASMQLPSRDAGMTLASVQQGVSRGTSEPAFSVRKNPKASKLRFAASRPVVGSSKSDGACFSQDVEWMDVSQKLSSREQHDVSHWVIDLERRLHEQLKKMSSAVQRLMSLSSAVPNDGDSGASPPIPKAVYDCWLHCHERRATTNRPWGLSLVAEYAEFGANDEYFVPCELEHAGEEAAAGGRTGTGRNGRSMGTMLPLANSPINIKAAGSSSGPTTRQRGRGARPGRRGTVNFDPSAYLPYQIPDSVSKALQEKDPSISGLAAAFPPFGTVAAKPVIASLHDIDAEIAEVEKWYDSEVTGPLSAALT